MGSEELEKLWSSVSESLPAEQKGELELIRQGSDGIALPKELTEEIASIQAVVAEDPATENNTEKTAEKNKSFATLVKDLSIPQKIKLALFGNKMARSFLIRDTNRQVPLFVLQNPQLNEEEVVDFARNSNLDDSVLRYIANHPSWMKNYAIKLNIVANARVPVDLSLRWLKYLQERDLRNLARSKNVPSVIATQARKLLEKRDK